MLFNVGYTNSCNFTDIKEIFYPLNVNRAVRGYKWRVIHLEECIYCKSYFEMRLKRATIFDKIKRMLGLI